ncbi:MAG: hypothetical protein IJ748_06795 [Bacteroidales bacterium]|nr:hypothetical protein [Bacteroidales bacterium]
MKKIFFSLVFTCFALLTFAQQKTENCPFGGRENCTGYCGRFTDENKDSYCDYSKLNEQTKNVEADKAKDEKARAEKHKGKHDGDKKCCKALDGKCKENNGDCMKKGPCSNPKCTNKPSEEKSCCNKEMKAEKKDCCKKDADKKCAKQETEKKSCCKEGEKAEKKDCCKKDADKKCEKKDCKHKSESK